jgi:hypothetical protein
MASCRGVALEVERNGHGARLLKTENAVYRYQVSDCLEIQIGRLWCQTPRFSVHSSLFTVHAFYRSSSSSRAAVSVFSSRYFTITGL